MDEALNAIVREIVSPLMRRMKAQQAGLVVVSYKESEAPSPIVRKCVETIEEAGYDIRSLAFSDLGRNPVEKLVTLKRQTPRAVFFIHFTRNSLHPHNKRTAKAVGALNLHREVFKTEAIQAVFWLNVSDLAMLHEKASNFLEYRARAIELEPTTRLEQKDPDAERLFKSIPENLPFPSLKEAFVGREEELEGLKNALRERGAAAIVQPISIKGFGGIGKTRLAVEYAWRHLDEYDAILFIRADSPEVLQANVAQLSGVLNLPEKKMREEKAQYEAVRLWLKKHDNWLLIMDNADDERAFEAVSNFVKDIGKGAVITTSRFQGWGAAFAQRSLDQLPLEAAVEYLLARTHERRVRGANDQKNAEEAARRLGGVALALEQAAAYINHEGISFEKYLKLWETQRAELLHYYPRKEMRHYDLSVAVTFAAAFAKLSDGARALLRLLACLAPDAVPAFLFQNVQPRLEEAVSLLREEKTERDFSAGVIRISLEVDPRSSIDELALFSLIKLQKDGGVRLHRLAAEVAIDQIPADLRREWIKCALNWVNEAAPEDADDVRTWPVMEALRPHAESLAEAAYNKGIFEPTARLMNSLGTYLYGKALYVLSEVWFRKALEIRKEPL